MLQQQGLDIGIMFVKEQHISERTQFFMNVGVVPKKWTMDELIELFRK